MTNNTNHNNNNDELLPMTPPTTIVVPTTTTKTTTSRSRRRALVSFAPAVNVCDVLHIDDYDDDEVAACWITSKEQELIELEIRNTRMIMGINNNQSIDNDLLCTRGLEGEDYYNSRCPINRRKQLIRDDVLNSVMDEQDYQFENGICNEGKIAKISKELTLGCQTLAQAMGEADQQWVINNNNKDMVVGSCCSKTTSPQGDASSSKINTSSLNHSQHRNRPTRATGTNNIVLLQLAGDKKRE